MSNLTRRVNRNELFIPFEQHFNKFFEEFFENPLIVDSTSAYPKIDAFTRWPVYDDPTEGSIGVKEFVVKATVPGVDPSALRIEISDDNVLTISGKFEREVEKNEPYYYIKEFSASSFKRSIKLLNGVSGDPKVELKDGILTLKWYFNVPSEAKEKTRVIKIPQPSAKPKLGVKCATQGCDEASTNSSPYCPACDSP